MQYLVFYAAAAVIIGFALYTTVQVVKAFRDPASSEGCPNQGETNTHDDQDR